MPLHDRSITIHLLFITRIHNLAENFVKYSVCFGFLHFHLALSPFLTLYFFYWIMFSESIFSNSTHNIHRKAYNDFCLCFSSVLCEKSWNLLSFGNVIQATGTIPPHIRLLNIHFLSFFFFVDLFSAVANDEKKFRLFARSIACYAHTIK